MWDAIDQRTGIVKLYELLEEPGDSVVIAHCGDHFEIHYHRQYKEGDMILTESDIEALRLGRIVWH